MLTLLTIRNIALIDELSVEFGPGLNLLTGETGSGKSIIVDSLAALTGERVSGDLIKQGAESARIEGLFVLPADAKLFAVLDEAGIEAAKIAGRPKEIIIRRDLSLTGKNRIFVNDQLVTQAFLKRLGAHLVDIHGQGEQATLYDTETHIEMLDDFAAVAAQKARVAEGHAAMAAIRTELDGLRADESEKLQLLDILRFQANEIGAAALRRDEETELEDEKRRLANVEKLAALSRQAFALLYDDEHSTLATLDRAAKLIGELSGYEARFRGFDEQLASARAVIEELGGTARDVASTIEASPERLNEVETRLAEIARLKRKYGGTVEAVLEHLADAERRLANIETAEVREEELRKQLAAAEQNYLSLAAELHDARVKAAMRFEKRVMSDLTAVALDKAKFEVRIETRDAYRADGTDAVEFYFSANPGEPARPLAKVASGGEASRLMLILKTAAGAHDAKTAVFDEIDAGIGGRVAEAVGRRLKTLAAEAQVFCVTHQAQIASLADRHFLVEKAFEKQRTTIGVRELSPGERVEELARMLAGETVTEQARENARAMLASAR